MSNIYSVNHYRFTFKNFFLYSKIYQKSDALVTLLAESRATVPKQIFYEMRWVVSTYNFPKYTELYALKIGKSGKQTLTDRI